MNRKINLIIKTTEELADLKGVRVDKEKSLYIPVYKNKKINNFLKIQTDGTESFIRSQYFSGYFSLGIISEKKEIILCQSVYEVITCYTTNHVTACMAFSKKEEKSLMENIMLLGSTYTFYKKDEDKRVIQEDNEVQNKDETRPETITATTESSCFGKVFSSEQLTKQMTPCSWLIRNFIPRGEKIGFIYGPSGVGKTFICLDMCLHIASGMLTWHGHICHQAKILYVAGESAEAINVRIASFSKIYGNEFFDSFYCYFMDTSLSEEDGLTKLFNKVDSGKIPFTPDLIVFDTLNCFFSEDENSATEVGKFKMSRILPLQARYKCSIIFIHHTSKIDEREIRGSTALKGLSDFTILVGKENESSENIKVAVSKNRIGKDGIFEICKIKEIELTDWQSDEDGFLPQGGIIEHVSNSLTEVVLKPKAKANLEVLVEAIWMFGTCSKFNEWSIHATYFRQHLKEQNWSENDIKKTFCESENRFFPELVSSGKVVLEKEGKKIRNITIISKEINNSISEKLKTKQTTCL